MENTIIYLIAFAGTGKYTIAKEISRLSGARLVDNHLINNPVFSLIRLGGVTPIPEAVWEKTWAIRHIVLDVVRDISPKDFSFIFTNELVDGMEDDSRLYSEIETLASTRGSHLIPVRLICDEEELCRRITSSNRADRLKDMNAEKARRKHRSGQILNISHPNLLNLDVTNLEAIQAAQAIIKHAGERSHEN